MVLADTTTCSSRVCRSPRPDEKFMDSLDAISVQLVYEGRKSSVFYGVVPKDLSSSSFIMLYRVVIVPHCLYLSVLVSSHGIICYRRVQELYVSPGSEAAWK